MLLGIAVWLPASATRPTIVLAPRPLSDLIYWLGLAREGRSDVRRGIVQHEGRTVAEFPLTAGVVGAVLAPVVAAIAALVALLKDCTIRVEREQQNDDHTARRA